MISDNGCSRTLKISFPFGCVFDFVSLIAHFTYKETEHGGWSWQHQEAFFAPAVFEFSGLLLVISNCSSNYLAEKTYRVVESTGTRSCSYNSIFTVENVMNAEREAGPHLH